MINQSDNQFKTQSSIVILSSLQEVNNYISLNNYFVAKNTGKTSILYSLYEALKKYKIIVKGKRVIPIMIDLR